MAPTLTASAPAMSRTTSSLMAAFQVIINGRFWVITEDNSGGVRFHTASKKPLSLNRCLVQSHSCNLPWKPKTENRGTSAFNIHR